MNEVTPSVIALHGSLVELVLRVNRIEEKLHMPPVALATFARPGSNIPPPLDVQPCSCDEALALRTRVRELEATVARLAVQP